MISAKTQENEAPSFKLLTISTAASKDSKGNRELNKEIIEARLSRETIKHYGGNVTDHASDAQKESRKTFDLLLSDERVEHGVVPQAIQFCDPSIWIIWQ